MRLRYAPILAASCLGVLLAPDARAAITDPRFSETQVVSGLELLTAMAWAPDGTNRLFLLQKTGEILVVKDGQLLAEPFAVVTPLVTRVECGLLGLAFDPDFASNGYLYVLATVDLAEQQILRFTASGDTGADRVTIVPGLPTMSANHNGGALGFGPDGKLYWAVGDNGAKLGIGDDLLTLNAKVGRANPDGSAPEDNPFFDGPGPNNDYIWARGFRNPFTLTFQPDSGRLWLNVVGTRMEQVFTPLAGDNGGWDQYESNQPAGFIQPVISYYTDLAPALEIVATGAVRTDGVVSITTAREHWLRPGALVTVAGVTDASFDATAVITSVEPKIITFEQAGPDAASGGGTATPLAIGGAITGGEFWDSNSVPTAYRGSFFFGDYNSGNIMRASLDAAGEVSLVDLWASGVPRMIDMAVGPDGDMYYASHSGSVRRASYTHGEQALIISRQNLWLTEGGKAAFHVRLAIAPGSDEVVELARDSGDSEVSVVQGASLSFTADNWSVPQAVVVVADVDADTQDDDAVISARLAGLDPEFIDVRVTDTVSDQNTGGAGNAGDGSILAAGAGPTGSGGAPASGGDDSADTPGGDGMLSGGVPGTAGGAGEGASSESGCGCRAARGDSLLGLAGALVLAALRLTRRRKRG